MIRCYPPAGVLRVAVASFALAALGSAGALAAAPTLANGDKPATVTLGHHGRLLTSATDHIVAFNRGGTIYVCAGDLTSAVMGTTSQDGTRYTITSFKGMSNSKTAVFTVGSKTVSIDGRDVALTAPPVDAYGRLYIPLSFFGSPGLRTKFTQAPDGASGTILMPTPKD